MAPLLSALVLVPALVVLWVLAFIVARRFQPTPVAIRLGALFVIGAVGGSVLAVAAFALFFGVGVTLVSRWQVVALLSALATCGLAGGALFTWACVKVRVLTLRSTGPAQKAAQSG